MADEEEKVVEADSETEEILDDEESQVTEASDGAESTAESSGTEEVASAVSEGDDALGEVDPKQENPQKDKSKIPIPRMKKRIPPKI